LMLTLFSLPIPLRISILNYLGQTQEELMNLTLVSKQIYKDCIKVLVLNGKLFLLLKSAQRRANVDRHAE
jgi:hypothetical protein